MAVYLVFVSPRELFPILVIVELEVGVLFFSSVFSVFAAYRHLLCMKLALQQGGKKPLLLSVPLLLMMMMAMVLLVEVQMLLMVVLLRRELSWGTCARLPWRLSSRMHPSFCTQRTEVRSSNDFGR